MGHSKYDAQVRRLMTNRDHWREIALKERQLRDIADREVEWYRNLIDKLGAERKNLDAAMARMREQGRA